MRQLAKAPRDPKSVSKGMPAETSNIARRRAAARDDGRAGYVERRQEILRAAGRVLKERGFRGTTINHVAESLGIDRATLYYYVGSKEELFHELVTDAVEANLELALAIRKSDAPAPEKLERLITRLMASYAEHYPVLYVMIQENLSHVSPAHSDWARKIRRINRRWEKALIDIIQAGQDEGTLRDSAPAWLVAYGILGMLGWTNRWFNPNRSDLTAQEIGQGFADTLLGGLVVPGR